MKILIDGDVIAHQVAARVGGREDLPSVADQVEAAVEHWARAGGPNDDILICLSEGRSFRYWVWPRYKENRKGKEAPPMLRTCFELLREMYDCWSVPGLEGDDCLGILGTEPGVETMIVTIDKDLQQVPGQHFNPAKDEVSTISPDLGNYIFHLQWLTGDAGDCLPGIPGVGPKKAAKFLEGVPPFGEYRPLVMAAYAEAGLSDEYARQMERCVRVLTRREWVDGGDG